MTDWYIKAKEFGNCNCSYGCPCQFNALPTHGFCAAVASFQIEEGRHGAVVLDGLRACGRCSLPTALRPCARCWTPCWMASRSRTPS